MASIKITQLTDIGSNIATSTLVPVVNMSGTPTTEKANLQILGNLILKGAGGANFAPVNISAHSSNTQVLFNDGNVVTGNANLIFNKTTGNFTTPNNMSVLGPRLNLGGSAPNINLTSPTLVAATYNNTYVQAALFNTSDVGSTDFTAYGAYGTDSEGWNDFGFTGQSFNDPNYTITAPGDGYIFLQTFGNSAYGGNLVLATGDNSVDGDIIFATGGFTSGQDKARITGAGKLLVGYSTSQNSSIIQANGNISTSGLLTSTLYATSGFTLNVGGNTTGGWNFGSDGVLTWPSDYGDWKIGNSNGTFEMSSTTSITLHTDVGNANAHFEFDQSGVFHAPGNIQMHGQRLSVGSGADSISLVAPTIVAAANSNTYVQGCIFNLDSDGSADFAVNGADSTDSDGWSDLGFTGHSFNDPNFTITGPGDGYLFVESYANGMYGGNLVFATGANSANGDIIFATGGFLTGQDKARITGDGKLLVGYSSSQNSSIIQANGNISTTGLYSSSNIDITSNASSWTFDSTGNLTLPGNLLISGETNLFGANAALIQANDDLPLISLSTGANGSATSVWVENFGDVANSSIAGVYAPLPGSGAVRIVTGNNATSVNFWDFNPNGTTVFPILTVDLHNGGNQLAQTLQFGDANNQAIITGPTPDVDVNAQRLIIQGQRGNGTGEGGDVYVWAGDADTNGGDIKIYAGDADNVSVGYGGYINIEGGKGYTDGGYINIIAGQSLNSQGAYINVRAGQGATLGGTANLEAGYGSVTGGAVYVKGGYGGAGNGGAVNIVGGASANGFTEYGNIYATAGASTWVFDNTGNLTLPGNIVTGAGSGGNITGANVIGANTFQSTVVAYSALPAATTAGLRAFVNNANLVAAGNFGAVVGGGGSNVVPVYSDGTNWLIG